MVIFLYALCGALFVVLSLPLIRRKVPPNSWYGFRVSRTREDPDIWYRANTYAGKGLLIAGIIVMVSAVLLPLFVPQISVNDYTLVLSGIMLTAVLAVLLLSLRYARHL